MKKALISLFATFLCSVLPAALSAAPPDDLTVTKKMTVNGAEFSTQSLLKGARERSTMQMNGTVISTNIRQCDLHRTLTVQDSTKAFLVRPDIEDSPNSKDLKEKSKNPEAPTPQTAQAGGTLTYTSTVKDTGERKQILGYNAKHLKMTIVAEPGPNSCSSTKQTYDIDGWYIDFKTVPGACQSFSPVPSSSGSSSDSASGGCQDKILFKQSGSVKPGYPVQETMTIQNDKNPPTTITTEVTQIEKTPLAPELFGVPADYNQVSTVAELHGLPQNMPNPNVANGANYAQTYQPQAQPMPQPAPQQA